MKIWQQYPFIRMMLPFAAGIVIAINSGHRNDYPLFAAIIVLFALHFWLTFLFIKKITFRNLWLTGLPANLLLFLFGYQITLLNTGSLSYDNIFRFSGEDCEMIIIVSEPPVEKTSSFKVIGCPEYIRDSAGWKNVSGTILLYFEKDTLVSDIEYGDEITLVAALNPVSPPQNPAEFDYRRYLSNRGIYNQAYVKSGNWIITRHDKGWPVISAAIDLRNHFLNILESNGITGDEFAVVSALLLGCSDYLDSDQYQAYSGSGVMHILSVSGLHVGIIYVFLNFLLAFMDKKRSLKIFRAFLLILMIWFYALITGLSPSVLRASAMFTAIAIGSIINRNAHIYNTLAASAFVLLVWNPYMITSVGFQLSYLAVIGIVWLYRPLNLLYTPRNFLLRYIWQTTAVSIAATVATLPLTLYYFRQFPNLFLVANLVAIPISTLIIYTGIATLLFSSITFIASLLSHFLVFQIKALNFTVSFIENLPFAVTRAIYINQAEMILLSAFLITLCSFFLLRNKRYLFVSVGLLAVILLFGLVRKIGQLNQQNIVVYNIPKTTAIDFIDRRQGLIIGDSVIINDARKPDFHIKNNRIISGLGSEYKIIPADSDYRCDFLFKQDCFIQFRDKKLVLVNPDFPSISTEKPVTVDFLLLSHNPGYSIHELSELFQFQMVIIDNSNSPWKTAQWIAECENSGIKFHSTKNSGAFVMDD